MNRDGICMENSFVVVCDWNNGTYISRVAADSPKNALKEWVVNIKQNNTLQLPEDALSELAFEEDECPVPIKGVIGCSCYCLSAKDEDLLLHFIVSNLD